MVAVRLRKAPFAANGFEDRFGGLLSGVVPADWKVAGHAPHLPRVHSNAVGELEHRDVGPVVACWVFPGSVEAASRLELIDERVVAHDGDVCREIALVDALV